MICGRRTECRVCFCTVCVRTHACISRQIYLGLSQWLCLISRQRSALPPTTHYQTSPFYIHTHTTTEIHFPRCVQEALSDRWNWKNTAWHLKIISKVLEWMCYMRLWKLKPFHQISFGFSTCFFLPDFNSCHQFVFLHQFALQYGRTSSSRLLFFCYDRGCSADEAALLPSLITMTTPFEL